MGSDLDWYDYFSALVHKGMLTRRENMTEQEKQQLLNYDLDLVIVTESPSGAYSVTDSDTQATARYKDFESMPEQIQKAVSILKILEEGQSVTRIGKKIRVGLYWVYIWK